MEVKQPLIFALAIRYSSAEAGQLKGPTVYCLAGASPKVIRLHSFDHANSQAQTLVIKVCMVLQRLHPMRSDTVWSRDWLSTYWNVQFLFVKFQLQRAARCRYAGGENLLDRTNVALKCVIKDSHGNDKHHDIKYRFLHFRHEEYFTSNYQLCSKAWHTINHLPLGLIVVAFGVFQIKLHY